MPSTAGAPAPRSGERGLGGRSLPDGVGGNNDRHRDTRGGPVDLGSVLGPARPVERPV
jgi:hypothetical protein